MKPERVYCPPPCCTSRHFPPLRFLKPPPPPPPSCDRAPRPPPSAVLKKAAAFRPFEATLSLDLPRVNLMSIILPGAAERALRHDFDIDSNKWNRTPVKVVLDERPFAEGSLRCAHRLQILLEHGERLNFVAKISKDPSESRETYQRDVQAQSVAKRWASEFNAQRVPKKVDFIDCAIIELAERPGRPLVGIEPFVEGVFQKHNSNISSGNERSTPNAFSHFTWEASKHTLLVCDIQGVGDLYTDPQIMTASGQGYGRGNLGPNGIKAFFMRHKCNQVCELLGLSEKGTSGCARAGTPGSPLLEHSAPAHPHPLRAHSPPPPSSSNYDFLRDSSPPAPPPKAFASMDLDDAVLSKDVSSSSSSSHRGSVVSSVDDDILGLFSASPPGVPVKAVNTTAATSGSTGNKSIQAAPPVRKSSGAHNAAPSISEADENLMDSILNGM